MDHAESFCSCNLSRQYAALSSSDRCRCFISHSGLAMSARTSSGTLIFAPVRHLKETTFLPLSNHLLIIFHWQLVEMPVISLTYVAVCHCLSIASKEPNLNHITRLCSSNDLCTLRMMMG